MKAIELIEELKWYISIKGDCDIGVIVGLKEKIKGPNGLYDAVDGYVYNLTFYEQDSKIILECEENT